MKIAVLVSGGVDSAVALRLLHDEGHDITAFYLKIWLEDELAFLGDCPWEEDLKYGQQICSDLKIPLEVISMQKGYWEKIVSYVIAETKAGRTPNPDMLCNQKIKFGLFYDLIADSYDKVATGHYARVEIINGQAVLKRSPDPIKDQTYFLAYLKQEQLKRVLFPLGDYGKAEVRQLADKYDLPNKNRPDSQGICFLGKIRFSDFIKEHLGERLGDIIDIETGEKMGQHRGFWFYTIGQRRGLLLSGGPWFVVDKDIKKNIVYISHKENPVDQKKFRFQVKNLNWISGKRPPNNNLLVKVRHGPDFDEAVLNYLSDDLIEVMLKYGDYSLASGQFAVFYDRGVCLGSGVIN